MKNMDDHVKLTCNRDIGELEQIVDSTERFFAKNSIGTDIRGTVDLAVEELFVNMVRYNKETNAQIEIEMYPEGNGIKVAWTDRDVDRFDPTLHDDVDVNAPIEQRTPGGLGIFLVRKLVDSIDYDYRNRVSRITFIKYQEPR